MAVNKKSGNMKSPVKFTTMTFNNLTVKFSHIQKPDLEYNSGHSVLVECNNELEKMIKEVVKQSGVETVNGLKKQVGDKIQSCQLKDGPDYIVFKNAIYSRDGVERFPDVYDMQGQRTMDNPYGGDVVNLAVRPKVWDMQGKQSISIYLNEVQIAEKNSGDSVTFAKPKKEQKEVSFDASKKDGPVSDEDLPF